MADLVGRLLAAVGDDRRESGLVFRGVYQPVGGAGERLMPPTYPDGPYLIEPRWVDGRKIQTVVLDQAPSQSNRVEQALLAAADSRRMALPLFELTVPTGRGPVRLTSLDFPHRYADAYLRDCVLDGVRFDQSEAGARLRATSVGDVRPLFEREPYSLVFGAWDSHRPGQQNRFPRIYTSSVFGLEPEEGTRQGGRYDPLNLSGAIDSKAKAQGDWKYLPAGDKAKGQKLSEIGHGHIKPSAVHGGVTVTEVRRRGWVSLAGLERLRFGDASYEAAQAARATLMALALAGDRLVFGRPSVWLRSGCDLTRHSEVVGFEVDGGEIEPLTVSASEAIGAFTALRDRTTELGIAMSTEVIAVEPTPQLAEAVAYSVTKSAPGSEG